MRDSWIDEEEFQELVDSFSSKKGRRKQKPNQDSPDPAREETARTGPPLDGPEVDKSGGGPRQDETPDEVPTLREPDIEPPPPPPPPVAPWASWAAAVEVIEDEDAVVPVAGDAGLRQPDGLETPGEPNQIDDRSLQDDPPASREPEDGSDPAPIEDVGERDERGSEANPGPENDDGGPTGAEGEATEANAAGGAGAELPDDEDWGEAVPRARRELVTSYDLDDDDWDHEEDARAADRGGRPESLDRGTVTAAEDAELSVPVSDEIPGEEGPETPVLGDSLESLFGEERGQEEAENLDSPFAEVDRELLEGEAPWSDDDPFPVDPVDDVVVFEEEPDGQVDRDLPSLLDGVEGWNVDEEYEDETARALESLADARRVAQSSGLLREEPKAPAASPTGTGRDEPSSHHEDPPRFREEDGRQRDEESRVSPVERKREWSEAGSPRPRTVSPVDSSGGGSLGVRLRRYARALHEHGSALAVSIRDDQGFSLFDEEIGPGGEWRLTLRTIKALRSASGSAGGKVAASSQVRLSSGRWVCVAPVELPSGSVILQVLLRQPMSELALEQWRELLGEVLQPPLPS